MDFLERIEQLMRQKGINKAQLAEGAGLSKTTVYSWWAQGYEGITLPKLKAIANYFGCTLDWLVCGDEATSHTYTLSEEEETLLLSYRAANDQARETALDTLQKYPRNQEKENLA